MRTTFNQLVVAGYLSLVVITLGCVVSDYPIITDTRGDFSGVIRTGHKAHVAPSATVALIWADGSDELFTMVYQNSYGDQKLHQFNSFDPTASVIFVDQTYCDWRYEGCAVKVAWNPHHDNLNDSWDYDYFPDCSGSRSGASLLRALSSRVGECGDAGFRADEQDLAALFAELIPGAFQYRPAYSGMLSAENTTITLHSRSDAATQIPIYGVHPHLVTDRLQAVLPVGLQVRHTLQWLIAAVDQNGAEATAMTQVGAVEVAVEVKLLKDRLRESLERS
jgi:hypothetical protein